MKCKYSIEKSDDEILETKRSAKKGFPSSSEEKIILKNVFYILLFY